MAYAHKEARPTSYFLKVAKWCAFYNRTCFFKGAMPGVVFRSFEINEDSQGVQNPYV